MKEAKSKNHDKILDLIKKAGDSENYETFWDEEGVPKIKSKENVERGKKSRASGLQFETRVREDLQKMGWIVDKWMNTVDYEKGLLVPAKRKFNPYKKVMVIGTGFPDFVAFSPSDSENKEIIGVEVKSTGYLDKIEKGMCLWLLENKIFSKILIAKKTKDGRRITVSYDDFEVKYSNKT